MLFGDTPGKFAQVLAFTTNGTSASQAFGISSGTSNCDASGIILAEREPEVFVAQNFTSIAKEIAAGEGEHLYTLSGVLGCPVDKRAHFVSFTQRNFETIYASDETTPIEMLSAVKVGISGDSVLSASCRN